MANNKLSSKTVKLVDTAIEHAFENVKAYALGPSSVGKRLFIGHDDFLSLKGLYTHAAKMEGIEPDAEVLKTVLQIAGNHLDSLKSKAKAQILSILEQNISNININPNIDTLKLIDNELKKVWAGIGGKVRIIVDNEATKAQTTALVDGITQINASVGIVDPTVYFVCVLDNKLCLEKNQKVLTSNNKLISLKDLKIGDILKNPTRPSQRGGNKILNYQIKQSNLIELFFDNNKSIKCSPDHPILVRAGPTYIFLPAKEITDIHDIVFFDEVNTKGQLQSVYRAVHGHKWMRDLGYTDSYEFWNEHKEWILNSLRTSKKRTEVLKKYKISIGIWDQYIKYIIKIFDPTIKIKSGTKNNNFNKFYLEKRHQSYINNYNLLGGDDWFSNLIKSGQNTKDISKQYNLSLIFLRKKLSKLNLISIIKARGGRANWNKNYDYLRKILEDRGCPHFTITSKPETKTFEMLKKYGLNIIQSYQISNLKVDMFLPDYNVVIEYDGSGHNLAERLGQKKSTAFIDLTRDRVLRKMGYRILRIKDIKDKVPISIIDKVNDFINNKKEFEIWHAL